MTKEEYVFKICKCGQEIKAPKNFPEKDDEFMKLRQYKCPNCSTTYSYDYDQEEWLD